MGNYDWDIIEARWKAGERSYGISKSLGGRPTRQAVDKMAQQYGWRRPKKAVAVQPDEIEIRNFLELVGDFKPVGSKDTPATRALILEQVSESVPKSVAARLAGINPDTLKRWEDLDQGFSAMLREAASSWLVS